MSFAGLRAERQSKQSKSFVNAGPKDTAASADQSKALIPTTGANASGGRGSSEPLYRVLPASVDIRSTTENGRGIWAIRPMHAGEIIFQTKPHIHVLSTKNLEHFCSSCVSPAPATGLKRCTRCRVLWYCSASCQNSDWALHKQECSAMQRWAAGAPSPDVAIPAEPIRCLGRVLWWKQKQGLQSAWARELDGMQSHRTNLPPSATESHTHLAHAVIRYLGLNAPGELGAFGITTAADIVDVISRFATNSITMTSPSLTPLGVFVSPPVALINHSCEPNAVVVFPRSSSNLAAQEPLTQVVALREIAVDEQIFTAYIDTTLPFSQRQQALAATYSFTCNCTLCSKYPRIDPRESIWCPKSCGGTCTFPSEEDPLTRCVKCGSAVPSTDSILDAIRIGQEALEKATTVQFNDLEKALQLTTNIIPILTSHKLLPSSHPLLALTRLHQSLLLASFPPNLTQEALDNVIRATSASVTGISELLCRGHPIRALALAELGKLLAVDEPSPRDSKTNTVFPPSGPARLRLAYETLVQAHNELKIGFGEENEGGEVGHEIREMAVRVEKELAVWKQGVKNVIEDTPKPKSGKR
ncbi:SET domain-containing protein [Artomyces pyxidatus]|uniref:SET domain-containing protein n=1 Tax=Artomyces pyxidatus TaxID=48021 RepID=A0ACB8TAG9_9AGAM|nr:SET domain-containing protein [Artomyces pyxidatus]